MLQSDGTFEQAKWPSRLWGTCWSTRPGLIRATPQGALQPCHNHAPSALAMSCPCPLLYPISSQPSTPNAMSTDVQSMFFNLQHMIGCLSRDIHFWLTKAEKLRFHNDDTCKAIKTISFLRMSEVILIFGGKLWTAMNCSGGNVVWTY